MRKFADMLPRQGKSKDVRQSVQAAIRESAVAVS